jgi:cell division transport system permease protein
MKQIKQTVKQLRRSPYQALAAALAMSLTFFVTSIFILLIVGGQIILNYIEQRPQVIAFFKDDASQEKINEISNEVKASSLVKDVKYVSKEDALAIYKERNKDDPLLLQSVTADFLPASIDISIYKVADISAVTDLVKQKPQVDKVITPENLVQELTKWTKAIRIGGLIFVTSLVAISFLIIVMVIGMRIALRREEIAIMNLVGATRWYISRPFFIEGALYGVIGATISIFFVYSLLLFYSPNIQNFLGPIQIFPINPFFFLYLWLAEVAIAIAVGVIGAIIALYRYLKL